MTGIHKAKSGFVAHMSMDKRIKHTKGHRSRRPCGLRFLLIILLATLTFTSQANEQGIDIVFVLDSSGSMKKTDRQRLRIQASKMFINLLDEQDRAAVVSFSGKAYAITGLLPLSKPGNETKLLKSIDKVSEKGSFTNIYQALEKARNLLKPHKQPSRKQHIILMSDGKMDVGQAERDLRLTERTLEDIAPALARERIKVHTLSFTHASNIPLMKLTAEDTRGEFSLLNSPDDIHQVFEKIFQRTKKPDMLPLNEDSFIVDDSIKEITVLATKHKANSRIALETPDGDHITATTRLPSVRWFRARLFDLITIRNPTSGYWLIKYSESGNKAYIITQLKLMTETASEVHVDTPFLVQAWLEKDGKLLRKGALMDASAFVTRVTYPNGRMDEYPLEDTGLYGDGKARDGYHTTRLSFSEPGEYRVDTILVGETFDRQKSQFITVKQTESETPFAVLDAPPETPTLPQTDTPAEIISPSPAEKPTEPVPPAQTESEAENGKDPHTAQAAPHEEESIPVKDEAEENHEQEGEEESNWLSGLLIFLLLNVIVGAIAGAYYVIKKYRASKKPEDSDEENSSTSDSDNNDNKDAAEGGEQNSS